ncbi:MAG: L-threonylcarbamoyladenylate synthase [bacterium]
MEEGITTMIEYLTQKQIDLAVEKIQNGKILIFPTETSYGIGCDATNQSAVNKIFKIKKRDIGKPFPIIVNSIAKAREYLQWSDLLDKIAKKYWPGALTIVAQCRSAKPKLAKGVVSEQGTVAIRVTSGKFASQLCKMTNVPIVATSANISGRNEIYSIQQIKKVFSDLDFLPDAIFDAGDLPANLPSTIIAVANNKVELLRQGDVIIQTKRK